MSTRALGMSLCLGLTACPGGPGDTAATEAITLESTAGGGAGSTTGGTTGGTTGTVTGESTTGGGTTETTAGEPVGASRVVYVTQEPGWLYHVDCSGATPGAPIEIHPPTADWQVVQPHLSPTRRWITYGLYGPFQEFGQTEGHGQWFARVDGPTPGAPVRVDLPDALRVDEATFSPDESKVAFAVNPTGQYEDTELYLCDFAPDGQCAPERWHSPLAGEGVVEAFAVAFSPDGSRIVYAGDPQGTGAKQIYLAGTGPGDADAALVLTTLVPPAYAFGPRFSADGDTLYFWVTPELGMPAGIFAVDLTSDPPGEPVPIWEPSGPATYHQQFRDDAGAILVWSGPDQVLGGELSLISLAGTKASPPMPLHDVPDRVRYAEWNQWAPGGKWVVYSALGDPNTADLFAVDVSGPEPGPPITLDEGVAGGDYFISPSFGPDDARVFYPRVLDPTPELYVAGLAKPAPATALHPPGFGALSGPFAVSPDGARIAVNGQRAGADSRSMFLVELAELAPVEASVPLDLQGGLLARPAWAADGQRVFYVAAVDGQREAHQVDSAAPGAPIRISSDEHNVQWLYVISPLP